MTRVLYVNQTAQVSGAERSLLAMVDGVRPAVEPVLACPPGELTDAARELGVRTTPIAGTLASFRLHPVHTTRGLFEIGRSALQVRAAVARLRPDLVHANTTRASLLAVLARHRDRPPIVAHIRDWAPDGRLPRLVDGVIGRRADAVVANSTTVGDQFRDVRLRRPVRVIHNAVDLDRFDPAASDGAAVRTELRIPAERIVLSVIGQLAPIKGQDDAIEILAGLLEAGCDAELLLVGTAKFTAPGASLDNEEFERRLHSVAAERGVLERVRFLGERGDVPDVLAASDLMLMPFWREGFGRVAIEAMALGVPVAAAAVGGPLDIVRPGVDGLLLPPREPVAWVPELLPLLGDRGRRIEMGAHGRERAREFSLQSQINAVMGLYGELVAGDPIPTTRSIFRR
ncbi:MAG TPA: glycosyltransferase family 4 protein [Solirubrobacterales bacterium]|nr:glycosyltransferase family 4 protein [Solirubrobacterales bacterium]